MTHTVIPPPAGAGDAQVRHLWDEVRALTRRVAELEAEVARLRERLAEKEAV